MKTMKIENQVAQDFADGVNNMSFNNKAFAAAICSQHRTLQQNAMRAMTACIKEWATQSDYDLRNEQTVMVCKKIMALVGDDLYFAFV